MMENDDKLIKKFHACLQNMKIEDNGFFTPGLSAASPTGQVVIGYTQCNLRHYLLCIILYFQWL